MQLLRRSRTSARPLLPFYGQVLLAVLGSLCSIAPVSLPFASPTPAQAEEPAPAPERSPSDTDEPAPHLLGDLGRSWLEQRGYRLEVSLTNDTFANTTGGIHRRFSTIGNLNTLVDIDTTQAGWWDDGRFSVWGIYVFGQQPSAAVGDFQYTSSIDSFETYLLYEAFYEHRFFGGAAWVRAGLKDFTWEFAYLEFGPNLINSSFFTPATITQIPYSFYPNTGLGVELSLSLPANTYWLAGVFDGKPSDGEDMRSRDLGLSAADGAYCIAEAGYQTPIDSGRHMKFALGGWYATGDYLDFEQRDRNANYGSYLLGEGLVWREQEGSAQGLGVFAQLSQAAEDRNFNSWYYGVGLHYEGLLPQRDEDVLIFGFNGAIVSEDYRDFDPSFDAAERVWELGYRSKILPYLTLTPDIQYVRHPGANPELDDAIILYLRSELVL